MGRGAAALPTVRARARVRHTLLHPQGACAIIGAAMVGEDSRRQRRRRLAHFLDALARVVDDVVE